MTIDVSKWLKREPYECVPTAIGELCIFGITFGGQIELHKEIGKPMEKCDPTEYIRYLSRYICFPRESLIEEKYKPSKPVLTTANVVSLSIDNLETIARIYVENNNYLTRKQVSKAEKNEKGETVVRIEYGEIESPRNEGESYVDYLFRLSIKEDMKQRAQMQKMFDSVSGLSNFSRSLSDSIKSTLSLGDTLKKTMESNRPISETIAIRQVEPKIPQIDWAEIEQRKEELRLKPFNELASQLDELIDVSTQSAEFLVKANEIQTRIAGEIKSSGDETTKFAQKNIVFSIVVIVLTVIGLVASFFTVYLSTADSAKQRQTVQEHVDRLSNKLSDIDSSIKNQNDLLKSENDRLKNVIAIQERQIKEIRREIKSGMTYSQQK